MSEASFIKKLASNERPVRDKALEALRQYLSVDKKGSLIKYQKLWKGLFYTMWFSDRPRPQQRLANNLASLFSDTIPVANFPIFVEAFWSIIIREWSGIDHHRIDKFYMLLRRVINSCFQKLANESWNDELVDKYLETLKKNVLSGDVKIPLSLPLHIIDIYIDELEKVLFESLAEEEEDEDEEEDDSEDSDAKKEKLEEMKQEIIARTPMKKLFDIWTELKQSTNIKVLKQRIDEDLLSDDRLVQWGVIEEEEDETEDFE